MKTLSTVIAAVVLFAGSVVGSVDEQKALAALRDIDAFKASLPPKVLVGGFGEDRKMPERFLQLLAGADSPELFALPATAKAPKMIGGKVPLYPDELRREGVVGDVDYLIFIGSNGRVVSIVEVSRSDARFALGVARSLTAFRFEPCEMEGKSVPVVIHFGLRIESEK